MCGIAGLFDVSRARSAETLEHAVRRMAATLHHRGPDDRGHWIDPASGIALGHTRLSILDLSPNGHQPMASETGRFVMVFNGEIYNHQALAMDLRARGASFRGHSDTEVLLAGFEHWGLPETLTCAIGMFAIAVWDQQEKVLHLARDRMGEKPLFYGWRGKTLIFGSELKALRAYPEWQGEVDPDALGRYLRLGYVPSPHSLYRGIYKLTPGSWLSIPHSAGADTRFSPVPDDAQNGSLSPRRFWSISRLAHEARTVATLPDQDAVLQLENLLRTVVREQMIADVPLGAFLSGGIDSSLVVALMQAESTRPVRTFTIGFEEAGFNEAEHARDVAAHLGTEHTELYINSTQALEMVPKLASVYDEPMADSAQIPTLLVSQLARRHVTVALSGDGGDEIFGGYNRYRLAGQLARLAARVPGPVRRGLSRVLTSLQPTQWDRILRSLQPFSKSAFLRQPRLGNRFHKFASALRPDSLPGIYQSQVSFWSNPQQVLCQAAMHEAPWLHERDDTSMDPLHRMLCWDQQNYLPDDHLVRVDRASMSTALEVRAPLLDARIVSHSWQLPSSLKVRGGVGKWILRQVLYRHVPASIVERPKMGFSVPIEHWLRGALRDWAEGLLDRTALAQEGLLCPDTVRKTWEQHLAGHTDAHHELWAVLLYLDWRRQNAVV